MSARLFAKNQIIEIEIKNYAFGGVGVGKVPTDQGDFAVFVQNTIPGQLVKAQVQKCDKRFAECRLLEVINKSPLEIEVPNQSISGAPFTTLPIEKQVEFKRDSTFDLYKRIGKIENPESLFDEFIQSPLTWHYRNKMEYSFSAIRYDFETKRDVDEFALGFKHRGTWWMVENLDRDSGIFDEEFETKLKQVRTWCIDSGLPAFHPPRKTGFFRFIVVRKSFLTNQLLINLVTSDEAIEKFDANAFSSFMQNLLGYRLAGLIYTTNKDSGDRTTPLSGGTILLYGENKLLERINGLDFQISMESFFQTNPLCAEKLYSKVVEYVIARRDSEAQSDEIILDLFCGTGTIAQLMARGTKQKIVGVDIEESAILDARQNAKRNGLSNVEFFAADVGRFLSEYPQYAGKISTIVLDPPRAGIAPRTLQKVIALGAPVIIYVSCNPATQSRDALILREAGYEMKRFSLVDQFPHTAHVESVAVFGRIMGE